MDTHTRVYTGNNSYYATTVENYKVLREILRDWIHEWIEFKTLKDESVFMRASIVSDICTSVQELVPDYMRSE